MTKNTRVISDGPSKTVMFHGYVLTCIIGVRWNLSPTGGMNNTEITQVTKDYLSHVVGNDEWEKQRILSYIKDASPVVLKKRTRKAFPSLFHKIKRKPLKAPDEIPEDELVFDIDKINKLKNKIQKIKEEMSDMNNETEMTQVETIEEVNTTNVTNNTSATSNEVEVSKIQSLTLDNFKAVMGRRFRITREQRDRIEAGSLTREGALEEYKNSLTNNR